MKLKYNNKQWKKTSNKWNTKKTSWLYKPKNKLFKREKKDNEFNTFLWKIPKEVVIDLQNQQ